VVLDLADSAIRLEWHPPLRSVWVLEIERRASPEADWFLAIHKIDENSWHGPEMLMRRLESLAEPHTPPGVVGHLLIFSLLWLACVPVQLSDANPDRVVLGVWQRNGSPYLCLELIRFDDHLLKPPFVGVVLLDIPNLHDGVLLINSHVLDEDSALEGTGQIDLIVLLVSRFASIVSVATKEVDPLHGVVILAFFLLFFALL